MSEWVLPSYGRVMKGAQAKVLQFRMKSDDLLVVVIDPQQMTSIGMFLGTGTKVDEALGNLKAEAETLSSNSSVVLEYKLVGCEALMTAAESLLKSYLWKKAGAAVRNEESYVIYYNYPARIRVAPLNAGPLSLETSPPAPVAVAPKASKIRVLVVDDSKTIRQLLHQVLSSDPGVEVVGMADRPSEALKLIQSLKPDVITLDIHMPEMDGITFLKSYLPKYPIPTVLVTSVSLEEGPAVLEGLETGAVDYIQKPGFSELEELGPLMIEKIKHAASARVVASRGSVRRAVASGETDMSRIIAIGSSTGGTEALRNLLTALPEKIPPIVIVQHIPPVFSKAFADRLNSLCAFEVKEAEDGDELCSSRVLVAPGATQMKLVKSAHGYKVRIDDSPPMNRHKPSVDFLFYSVAELVGKKALGVILTGMGADGAKGLLQMKNAGAQTIAQDEKSCVVFGMPKEAIKLGAADKILALDNIAPELLRLLSRKKAA